MPAKSEDMYYQASLDDEAPSRFSRNFFKVSAAFLGGACLALISMRSAAVSFPNLQSTSLLSGPTSLRQGPMTRIASLPGASPWKELAIAAIEGSQGCRDVSMKANPYLKSAMASLNREDKAKVARLSTVVNAKAKEMGNEYGLPGAIAPLGYWDPWGLSTGLGESRMLFFREAEVKHGRVCMASSLGFIVGERFHPLFGGENDLPSLFSWQDSSLSFFWPAIFIAMAAVEDASQGRENTVDSGFERELKNGLEPGNIGFDPLNLRPQGAEEFEELQNKEILNGRLAMISLFGMIAEELVTKEKLHGLPF